MYIWWYGGILQSGLNPLLHHPLGNLQIILFRKHHMAITMYPYISKIDMIDRNPGLSQEISAAAVVNRMIAGL